MFWTGSVLDLLKCVTDCRHVMALTSLGEQMLACGAFFLHAVSCLHSLFLASGC